MSKKTSREIALERRKAMSDSGKKLLLILQLLKIEFDLLKIYRFLGLSLLLIIIIFLNQLQNIFQKLR
jgi:hypothetical protein